MRTYELWGAINKKSNELELRSLSRDEYDTCEIMKCKSLFATNEKEALEHDISNYDIVKFELKEIGE